MTIELMTKTKRPNIRLYKVGTVRVPGNKRDHEWTDVTYFNGRHHKLGVVAYDRVRYHSTERNTGMRTMYETWYLTHRWKNTSSES